MNLYLKTEMMSVSLKNDILTIYSPVQKALSLTENIVLLGQPSHRDLTYEESE